MSLQRGASMGHRTMKRLGSVPERTEGVLALGLKPVLTPSSGRR